MLLKLLVFTLQKDILNVFDHESGIIWNMEISFISEVMKRPIKNKIDSRSSDQIATTQINPVFIWGDHVIGFHFLPPATVQHPHLNF